MFSYLSKKRVPIFTNVPKEAQSNPLHTSSTSKISAKNENELDITVLTYNLGNGNPGPEVAEQLKDAIMANENNPEIIVIALQEAKSTWNLRENFGERIVKRFKDELNQALYTLLPGHQVLALTCPHPGNWINLSRTHLVIAYKTSAFPRPKTQIRVVGQGQVVTKKRDHKGGIYTLLSIYGSIIAVISIHLNSFNLENAQAQADALITAAKKHVQDKGSVLTGIIMAGDFNTRFDPDTLQITPSDQWICHHQRVLKSDHTHETASRHTIGKWQKNYSQLEELTFIGPYSATVVQDYLVRNIMRKADRWDYGVLDWIAITDYTENKKFLYSPFEINTAEINKPRDGKVIKGEVSDHAAVIARLKLAPPGLKLKNDAENQLKQFFDSSSERTLQQIHNFLVEKNDAALFRAYFEYAIDSTIKDRSSVNHFLYHLQEIEEIKTDIAFIIDHLDALLHQDVDVDAYNALIFGTCERITLRPQDCDGRFMQEKFQQLLRSNKIAPLVKFRLLKPFAEWLDKQHIRREHYTISKYNVFNNLGMFEKRRDRQNVEASLSIFERKSLY